MDGDAIRTLMVELLRAGVIPREVVDHAATELDAGGRDQAAHELRCLIVRAAGQRTSEWQTERAAKRKAEQQAHREAGEAASAAIERARRRSDGGKPD